MSKLCKDCACEWVCGITHTPELNACENYKADAITELESLKAEMNVELFKEYSTEREFDSGYESCLKQQIDRIDNHIKELNNE